jgi:hypothetical protein
MSLHDFQAAKLLSKYNFPFNALIMDALRQANHKQKELLSEIFPLLADELKQRYAVKNGILPGEKDASQK